MASIMTFRDKDGNLIDIPALQGPRGKPGKLTNVTASIDDTTGTPSVAVTLGGTEEERTLDLAFSGLKGSSGDIAPAIIDVTALPETDIREDVFYRVVEVEVIDWYSYWMIYYVETLPEVGEPFFVDNDFYEYIAYYSLTDGMVYAYITDDLASMTGLPAGWYSAEIIASSWEMEWGGIVSDYKDVIDGNTFYIVRRYINYTYKNGWKEHKSIGHKGVGEYAEVFNNPLNRAEGYCSHVEGLSSSALGDISHAEGYKTQAIGDCSHSEGYKTYAGGNYAHAEGRYSYAEGRHSHAEGDATRAAGRSQHAQGEYNIIDPEYNEDDEKVRGKYAHIVGNGTSDSARSNAHTLDWNGLGWFAGGLKVGGTGQDDEAAKNIATEDYVQAQIASMGGTSNVEASKITAGTLGGKVQANATAAATLGNAQVRDIIISNTDLTAGTSELATGTVYLVYE